MVDSLSQTAKGCMTFEKRAETPPEIRRYRRSANLEPGKRFQHPKLSNEDLSQLEHMTFGVNTRSSGVSAADLIAHGGKSSLMQSLNMKKAEGIYYTNKREPLGQTFQRHYHLPEKYYQGAPFGLEPQEIGDSAKTLIFPRIMESESKNEIYKKSHGSYDVGEQKKRDYKWENDPTNTVFGKKGDASAFNGVSKNVAVILGNNQEERGPLVAMKNVEDFRELGDILGTTKNLGQGMHTLPKSTIFGKPSIPVNQKNTWGAAETIRGEYPTENKIDDLGCSITPGFRNITTEKRSFGVPSIRTDLPLVDKNKKSMADSQNFGHDPSAKELISPPSFSDLSISATAFYKPMQKEKIIKLFEAINVCLAHDLWDFIYDLVPKSDEYLCSVHDFRVILNDYLYAKETGHETEWLAANGYFQREA